MDADRPIRELTTTPEKITPARARAFLALQPKRVLSDADIAEYVSACWEFGPLVGVTPARAFAQSCVETNNGRFTGQVPAHAHNVAGIGAINDGKSFLIYDDFTEGWRAYYVHLLAWCGALSVAAAICAPERFAAVDPRLPLVAAGVRTKGAVATWRDLGGRWAVTDGIDWQRQATMTQNYGWKIEQRYDAIVAATATVEPDEGATMVGVVIAAGHRNNDGGDPYEMKQTGELAQALARACRDVGLEPLVLTPDGPDPDTEPGDGMYPGGIWDVARNTVKLLEAGRLFNFFVELHTEGGGGTGAFVIYPDDPTTESKSRDLDVDVRDVLGPMIAKKIAAATGLAVGGTNRKGVMSERATGVGGKGDRLGIFNLSAPIRAAVTRFIVEVGAHDKEPDLSISKRPGFADKAARAIAEAIAEFAGLRLAPVDNNVIDPAIPATPTPPRSSEQSALIAFGDSQPFSNRGILQWEGAADLRVPFGGAQLEALAKYERQVVHRLKGQNHILTLALWDQLRAEGKIVRWPGGDVVKLGGSD